MPEKQKGSLAVAVASLLWSADGILRRSLYTLPPSVVVFFEHLLGSIVLLFAWRKWVPEAKTLDRKTWIVLGIVSLFSGALGTIFYTAALGQINYIQYSVVILLQQLEPIWAISAAAFFLKEKISKKFILWALVALIAAYLIAFRDLQMNTAQGQGTLIAGLLALGAGMMWGFSTSGSKYVLRKVSFITATALRFLLTAVFSFMIVLLLGQAEFLKDVTSTQWGTLLLITFSTGMVAIVIYYYGLKRIPAHVCTIIELLFPLSAILIDFFYFNNPLSLTQLLGGMLLIVAISQVVDFRDKQSS